MIADSPCIHSKRYAILRTQVFFLTLVDFPVLLLLIARRGRGVPATARGIRR